MRWPSNCAAMLGPIAIAYCPSVVWLLNVIVSVWEFALQLEPVICESRSTPPGPVKLATSSTMLNVEVFIALLNVKLSCVTGPRSRAVDNGLCDCTNGSDRLGGRSNESVTVVALALAVAAL